MGCTSLKSNPKKKGITENRNIETYASAPSRQHSAKLVPIIAKQSSISESLRILQDSFKVYSIDYQDNATFLIEYNTSNQTLESTKLHSNLFIECGCAVLNEGEIMLAGGADLKTSNETSRVFFIDPESKTINEGCQMPFAKRRLRLLKTENYIYAIGGVKEVKIRSFNTFTMKQSYINSFLQYSIIDQTWVELEDLPVGIEFPGCFYLMGRIYVTGGSIVGNYSEITDNIQVYEVVNRNWKILELKLPFGVYGHMCEVVENGAVVIFGGTNTESRNNLVCLKYENEVFKEFYAISDEKELFLPLYCCSNISEIYSFNEENELFILDHIKAEWKAL